MLEAYFFPQRLLDGQQEMQLPDSTPPYTARGGTTISKKSTIYCKTLSNYTNL
jgi:hypothetical protein